MTFEVKYPLDFVADTIANRLYLLDVCSKRLGGGESGGSFGMGWKGLLKDVCSESGARSYVEIGGVNGVVDADGKAGLEFVDTVRDEWKKRVGFGNIIHDVGTGDVGGGELSDNVGGDEGRQHDLVDRGEAMQSGRLSGLSGVSDSNPDPGVVAVSGVRRGRWYEHNKQKKMRARQLKESGVKAENVPEWRRKPGDVDAFTGETDRLAKEKRLKEKFELQCSLEKKWAAENELKQFEAERRLRVLKSQDEDTIIRMQRAQVMRTTEKCKVDTERAFKSLLKTGNVSGLPAGGAGTVETVISGDGVPSLTRSNGESISPDSSASMQEFRKCQKDLLDAEKRIREKDDVLERLALMHPEDYAKAHAIATMKTAYTLDSNGEAEYIVDGQLGPDGKIHVDNLNDIYGPNYAHKKYKELRETEGDDLIY